MVSKLAGKSPKKKKANAKPSTVRIHMGRYRGIKPQYPPQGGEARICVTLCVSMVLAVLSAVTIIYATVIVYTPALDELDANLQVRKGCVSVNQRLSSILPYRVYPPRLPPTSDQHTKYKCTMPSLL